MSSPWQEESVAVQQRALVDQQLARWKSGEPMPQFSALRDAVAFTKCPGGILEVGCASGYSMEIVPDDYRTRFWGVDISSKAIELAERRYPSATWGHVDVSSAPEQDGLLAPERDIVIDGSCLLHIDDWKAHLRRLSALSRRWVILHRVPLANDTHRTETRGYGQTFPAWKFASADVEREMKAHGFEMVKTFPADGGNSTAVFAKPRVFCTYADEAYGSRLWALQRSLVRHAGPHVLHVLDWSPGATLMRQWLEGSPTKNVEFWPGAGFMTRHQNLRPENLPGPERSKVEHYWTRGPAFISDVMKATGEPVTYLDADLYAFSSLEPMFAEIGGAPAGFVGHNFARKDAGLPGPTVESHRVFGLYNVGAVYFADPTIAARWAEMCRQWCYDRPEMTPDGRVRYGDQKYLEWLCDEFPGCHVVKEPAAHVGPWNANTRPVSIRGGVIYFGDRPLALYHFSGYRELPHGHTVMTRPEYMVSERFLEIVYQPYVKALGEADGR